MKILVTDGNNRAALAITRALGREGHEIIVGSERKVCLASKSKYCSSNFSYPDPIKEPDAFINLIMKVTQNTKPRVLLPVSEITTLLIMENTEAFKGFCTVPFHSFESVDKAANKFEVVRLADDLGIPIPKSYFLEKSDDIRNALSFSISIGFPIVIKPSRSRILNIDGWRSTAVKYANNKSELEKIVKESSPREFPLLIQERIYGTGVGLFACMSKGTMVAAFSHQRIREKPPSGGVSVLRKSIPPNEILKTQSERLLKELNWQGVAMVEFKEDKISNDFKLMEVNGRFWGSLQLAIDAGVNFPSLSVKIALDEDIQPILSYKTGIKTRWFWGDVDVLLTRLLKKNKNLNLPNGYPGRVQLLLNFLKFWEKDLHYEIINKDDIKPWFYETYRWFFKN